MGIKKGWPKMVSLLIFKAIFLEETSPVVLDVSLTHHHRKDHL